MAKLFAALDEHVAVEWGEFGLIGDDRVEPGEPGWSEVDVGRVAVRDAVEEYHAPSRVPAAPVVEFRLHRGVEALTEFRLDYLPSSPTVADKASHST